MASSARPAAVDGMRAWLERCRTRIEAKEAKPGQENLHQPFPGFSTGTNFGAELVFDDALVREIPDRQLRLLAKSDMKAAIAQGAGLYADGARSLAETGRCRVILCARPEEIREHDSEPPAPAATTPTGGAQRDRDRPGLPRHAQGPSARPRVPAPGHAPGNLGRHRQAGDVPRPLQDEATRAWNLHIALYYKAGGTPWRMPRRDSDLSTCYVGVSFYRTTDGEELHTAVAQVFNERGNGVVVRGGTATSPRPTAAPPGGGRRPQAAQ